MNPIRCYHLDYHHPDLTKTLRLRTNGTTVFLTVTDRVGGSYGGGYASIDVNLGALAAAIFKLQSQVTEDLFDRKIQ